MCKQLNHCHSALSGKLYLASYISWQLLTDFVDQVRFLLALPVLSLPSTRSSSCFFLWQCLVTLAGLPGPQNASPASAAVLSRPVTTLSHFPAILVFPPPPVTLPGPGLGLP